MFQIWRHISDKPVDHIEIYSLRNSVISKVRTYPALTMEILQWENLQELIFLSPLFSGEQGWVNARFCLEFL